MKHNNIINLSFCLASSVWFEMCQMFNAMHRHTFIHYYGCFISYIFFIYFLVTSVCVFLMYNDDDNDNDYGGDGTI